MPEQDVLVRTEREVFRRDRPRAAALPAERIETTEPTRLIDFDPRAGNFAVPLLFFTGVFALFYGVPSRVLFYDPVSITPSAVDSAIPFLAWTVLIYMTQFLLLPVAIILSSSDLRRTHAYFAMLISTIFSGMVFFACPTRIPRDLAVVNSGGVANIWSLLYAMDGDTNCLPSLHVSLALLSIWAVAKNPRVSRFAVGAWALLIIFSTLTTKQHLLIDVLGGALVAIISAVAASMIPSRARR